MPAGAGRPGQAGCPGTAVVQRTRPQERRRRDLGRDRRETAAHLSTVQVDEAVAALRALVEHREDPVRARTQTVNRLHTLLTQLIPGGAPAGLSAATAAALLRGVRPKTPLQQTLRGLATDLVTEIRRLD
jgi:transposase